MARTIQLFFGSILLVNYTIFLNPYLILILNSYLTIHPEHISQLSGFAREHARTCSFVGATGTVTC